MAAAEARRRAILEALDGALDGSLDDFDRVAHATALARQAYGTLADLYGSGRLDGWREAEDPALLRLASGIKNLLEEQKAHLDSVSGALLAEEDTVSRKITSRRGEIDRLLKREKTLLQQGDTLLAAENDLRSRRDRVADLEKRLAELSALEKELAGSDTKTLSLQVSRKTSAVAELEQRHKPLLERKDTLEKRYADLREAVGGLEEDLSRLSSAHGETAREITGRLPEWVDRVRARADLREEKVQRFLTELTGESERLAALEAEVQTHLARINDYAAAAAGLRDVLATHFHANRELDRSFARSLGGMEEGLRRQEEEIEAALSRHDEMLAALHRRIKGAADAVEKLRVTG